MRSFFFLSILLSTALVAQVPTLEPGTLVDRANDRIYTMSPEGAVVALDIKTGNEIWKSLAGQKPLGLMGETLVVYEESKTEFSFLNAADGTRTPWSAVQTGLPQGTWQKVDDGLGRSLAFSFKNTEQGAEIYWQTLAKVVSPLPPGQVPRNTNAVGGALRLDGQNGIAASFDAAFPEAVPPLRLLKGTNRAPGVTGRQLTSVDREHILVSTLNNRNTAPLVYTWTLYDKAGTRIGTAKQGRSAQIFLVSDRYLVTLERPSLSRVGEEIVSFPLRLKVTDLTTAAVLWEKPIRDTAYRGPYPP